MAAIAPVPKLDKKQEKLVNRVKDGLTEINKFGIPIDMLNLNMQIKASTTAQMVLSDTNPEWGSDLLASITGSNITIPPVMGFRY
jgi:hypothetical protein